MFPTACTPQSQLFFCLMVSSTGATENSRCCMIQSAVFRNCSLVSYLAKMSQHTLLFFYSTLNILLIQHSLSPMSFAFAWTHPYAESIVHILCNTVSQIIRNQWLPLPVSLVSVFVGISRYRQPNRFCPCIDSRMYQCDPIRSSIDDTDGFNILHGIKFINYPGLFINYPGLFISYTW